MIGNRLNYCCLLLALCALVGATGAHADPALAAGRVSDVLNTKHNFSARYEPDLPGSDLRTVKAGSENQSCVFCHTPHGRPNEAAQDFLWNQALSAQTYTPYVSDSFNGGAQVPGNGSKMCLSCHDGTVALGTVNVYTDPVTKITYPNSSTPGNPSIALTGTATDGTMPARKGATTGYTSDLGTDLSNDHPIGFTYDAALDSEIVAPATVDYIGVRIGRGVVQYNQGLTSAGGTPPAQAVANSATRWAVPLEHKYTLDNVNYATTAAGSLECTSCHDPHLRSTDNSINIKFLRLNRLQVADPGTGNTFAKDSDINCLACHKKTAWGTSAHANPAVANEVYDNDAAALREFPAGTQVWQASCVNCHDPHTVQGARWLLREGAAGAEGDAATKGRYKIGGGVSAGEETCYQCHTSNGILVDLTQVPDIESQALKGGGHDIAAASETHTIINADQVENAVDVGMHLRTNRHVECSDCHHPHRMTRNQRYDANATTPDAKGTHVHDATAMPTQAHSNTASGVLRGVFGIRPNYYSAPSGNYDPQQTGLGYTELTGDPSAGAIDIVTKEYEVCIKCHSDYGQTISAAVPNIAAEFEPSNAGVSAGNYVSWHPIAAATGRTAPVVSVDTYMAPFGPATPVAGTASDASFGFIGAQTMYCSDCHASDGIAAAAGPHGSTVNKLLAAPYTTDTGKAGTSGDVCFTCHRYEQYADPNTTAATVERSGFSCAGAGCVAAPADQPFEVNLHALHAVKQQGANTYRCMDCHVSRPHGSSNKALLANANDALPRYAAIAPKAINTIQSAGNWVKASCTNAGCH